MVLELFSWRYFELFLQKDWLLLLFQGGGFAGCLGFDWFYFFGVVDDGVLFGLDCNRFWLRDWNDWHLVEGLIVHLHVFHGKEGISEASPLLVFVSFAFIHKL